MTLDPSVSQLAACGGDTVKLFDLSDYVDPRRSSFSPLPGHQVNSVKWNHTIASAGDGNRISLWHTNGQSLGTMSETGDTTNETISTISFSNKSSRYICSGGSGQVVKIWDLKRKHCIKWLKGHSDTITGAMYNCEDEHLASISLSGDLILHNLASGTRATELKDPNEQVLRVLDYSRISRHLLVTAGDDGSVHLWDTTGRGPKVSWSKQHSAPTTGVCFSPSNDKIIASVGLDKKLYSLDSASKRPTLCIPYKTPFSSLAFGDDGWVLAAGTNNGQIIFFDVRGKLQPFISLLAYSASEAVTSLCWQRTKPVTVNEHSCNAETGLLGGAGEDLILMPDPLPSVTSSSLSHVTAVAGSQNFGHSSLHLDAPSVLFTVKPHTSYIWTCGKPSRAYRKLFSQYVRVGSIAPSLDELSDDHNEEGKKDAINRKLASLLYPVSERRLPFAEEGNNSSHPIEWKSDSSSKQDDTRSSLSFTPTPTISSKSEESVPTWGSDEDPSYKLYRLDHPSFSSEKHAHFSSITTSLRTKSITGQANSETQASTPPM